MTVLNPWYRSLDFLSVIATAMVILVLLVNLFRKKRTSPPMQSSLDGTLVERTHLARDLNKSFLRLGEAAKHSAEKALLRHNEIATLNHTLQRFSDLVGLPAEEEPDMEPECGSVPVDVTFIVVGQPREISPTSRNGVYRIGVEAIRHAFIDSGASKLLVELVYDRDFYLRVLDDGGRMVASDPDRGRPSPLIAKEMHEQAIVIGSVLSLSDRAFTGSEVQLLVPGQRAYAKAADLDSEI